MKKEDEKKLLDLLTNAKKTILHFDSINKAYENIVEALKILEGGNKK